MFTYIFAELITGFKRIWKLYVINIIAVIIILLLFAYIDGSRRQLNLQNTVFSGEVVVKVPEKSTIDPDTLTNKIMDSLPSVSYAAKKLRTGVTYKLSGTDLTYYGEMIGVDAHTDIKLKEYISILEGEYIKEEYDILLPSTLKRKMDIAVGDIIQIMGKTADEVYNTGLYKIKGIYNSPELSLFSQPKLLISYKDMENFYFPGNKDIDFCLFFKKSIIPENINKKIIEKIFDNDMSKVEAIEQKRITVFDLLNISVQFNVFLLILIYITIFVILSIIIMVNFNIYLVLFRNKQRELGTFLSFGIKPYVLTIALIIQSLLQILFSTVIAIGICFLISFFARSQVATGFIEVLFVLLSGTNKIDFFLRLDHIRITFFLVTGSVLLSQIPIYIKMIRSNPINLLRKQ